jgi:hypothetical protein
MSPGEFYNELKGWQTGIGSMLGFVALMMAALWNFRLNRRRDAALRAEEALSVATALYGEILMLRKEIGTIATVVAKNELNPLRKLDKHFLKEYPLSEPLLYKALASKIGLLSSDLVVSITAFHKDLQEAKTGLPLLIENPQRKTTYSAVEFLLPARNVIENIRPTLEKIEHMASILKPVENIDLDSIEIVINREEEIMNHGDVKR